VAAGTVGGGLTSKLKLRVSDSDPLSTTLIMNENAPVCVGTPPSMPVEDNVRPAGNPLGEIVTLRCAEILPNVNPGEPSNHE
jgi:hypothetical protein